MLLRHSAPDLPVSLIWFAFLLLFGCASGTYFTPQLEDSVVLPEHWQQETAVMEQHRATQSWCIEHPVLEAIIAQALEENFSLQAAWARLEQSEAVSRSAEANGWPEWNASAGVDAKIPLPEPPRPTSKMQYRIATAASYEVDLWGRLAKQRSAAEWEVETTRADVETAALSLTAELTETWFDLIYQRALLQLLAQQQTVNEEYLELTMLRLGHGQANALDITQQQQQIDALEAQRTQVLAAETNALQKLQVLLGGASPALDDTNTLPPLPPLPAVGVPADLLDQRPDIRAARSRLQAADERTAIAVKSQLPTLKLDASIALQHAEISELFSQIYFGLGATLSYSILDGGRREAEVDRTVAVARERLYTYQQVLADAMREVEAALVREQQQISRLAVLTTQQERARHALELSRERYRLGALDYLRVLTAIQSLQQIERSLLEAQRQLLTHRISLCRALGGSWTRDLQPTRKELP